MLLDDGTLLIAKGDQQVSMLPQMCNRHGLIAGATGTGKTVTLKTIAQTMSDAGIPTFLADVKGDVSGVCVPGEATDKLVARLKNLGIENYPFHGCPTRFWDIYGEQGTPVRTTITEMGPLLLSRLLDLSDVQAGVLNIAFRVADDQGMPLLDLKDLRAMIGYLGENSKQFNTTYGAVSSTSVGAIQRSLLTLEDAGGDIFFGEPGIDIEDWIACDENGKGYINVLNCVKLIQSPLLYSTFLLWMLTELYEVMPEVGDVDKPKLCFFFDEAHLLFTDAPKALLDKIEQIVKLIRSKGVGVFFITQNPADIPDDVLAQLGNRVQHALRAYTPAEQKGIKAASDSFRVNPAFKTEDVLTELGTGEALISFLDEKGAPQIVQRAMVIAPTCSMGAADDATVKNCIAANPLNTKYSAIVDRDSAYEMLNAKMQASAQVAASQQAAAAPAADATAPAADAAAAPADAAAAPAAAPAAPTQTPEQTAAEAAKAQRQQEQAIEAAKKEAAKEQKEADREAAAEKKAQEAAEKQAEREKKQHEKQVLNAAGSALKFATSTRGMSLIRNVLGMLVKK